MLPGRQHLCFGSNSQKAAILNRNELSEKLKRLFVRQNYVKENASLFNVLKQKELSNELKHRPS